MATKLTKIKCSSISICSAAVTATPHVHPMNPGGGELHNASDLLPFQREYNEYMFWRSGRNGERNILLEISFLGRSNLKVINVGKAEPPCLGASTPDRLNLYTYWVWILTKVRKI